MINFVLCGHGTFGSSLKYSLEMLLPEVSGVSAIDFDKSMDSTDLENAVKEVISSYNGEPTLFICDIVGGAPFKVCAIEAIENKNIRVVAGTNLASLLEVYFQRDQNIDNVLENIIDATKNSIDYFPR